MKKSVAIVALAVCAMSITSCAPAISQAEAREISNEIKAKANENGDYVCGNVFALDSYVFVEEDSFGIKKTNEVKGYVHVDLDKNYARTRAETSNVYSGYGEKETESSSTEAYVYLKDGTVYFGYETTANNEIIDKMDESFSYEGDYHDIKEKIDDIYFSVSTIFNSAVNAIFKYVNSIPEDQLSKYGISLGSYGEGSLVITEKISGQTQQGNTTMDTTIEFSNFMLKQMKSSVIVKSDIFNSTSKLDYSFKYDSCPIKY